MGQECEAYLKSSDLYTDIYSFKNNCINFYQTASEEMQKRFFENNLVKYFNFLSPKIALELEGRNHIPNLDMLCQRFSNFNIDRDQLEYEWRELPCIFNKIETEKMYSMKVDELWFEITKIKNCTHSSTFQSKKPNRIGHEALNAICVVRNCLLAKNSNCVTIKVTSNHLKLHSNDMYSFKK